MKKIYLLLICSKLGIGIWDRERERERLVVCIINYKECFRD